jgi:hypothetical protein
MKRADAQRREFLRTLEMSFIELQDAASERLGRSITEEEIETQLATAEERERATAQRELRAAIG